MKKVYSHTEEYFNCDSIDEAVQNHIEGLWRPEDPVVGEVIEIYEGMPQYAKAADYFARGHQLIEMADENACDNCGEFAEDWVRGIPDSQVETLTERLADLVNDWATEYDLHPKFYMVEGIVPIQVRLLSEDGDWERA